MRTWVDENRGTIEKWEDFECYIWPDPETAVDYDLLEKICKVLPEDMKLVSGVAGGVLEHVVWIMGLRPFSIALYRDPKLVKNNWDGQEYTGTLLSGNDDVILQAADGQVTVVKLDQIKEFAFPALPEGLITKPTLVWQLESAQGNTQDVEVTYLTGGINWQANYVLVLADDEKSLDLDGWVTLDNRSGASFKDLSLIHI